jgi:hypothetical protein
MKFFFNNLINTFQVPSVRMTQEVLGIHQLFTYKGPQQHERQIASLSKLGYLALAGLEGIHILSFASSTFTSTFLLKGEEGESYVSCQWSPVEFGCFLGVRTASGNLLVYAFEGFKRWRVIWKFISNVVCHFEWFHCQRENRLLIVLSTADSKETKVFALENDFFVQRKSFGFGFLTFKINDLGMIIGYTKELELFLMDLKEGKPSLL